MDTYYRLILTSTGQATYSSPVYNNINFPDLSPYRFCKVFVESCGLTIAEENGNNVEKAHDFVSIELADYASSNTQICNGSNTSNSSILDVISGVIESHTGEGHGVIKCNKNKVSDILLDAPIFPINILQNNSIKLHIRYADDNLIIAPPSPHNQYKIILGIQLIE